VWERGLLFGWTQINHPFNLAVSLANAKATYQGSAVSMTEAVRNGWLFVTVYEWVSGNWQTFDLRNGVLEPGHSYWIYAYKNGVTLTLVDREPALTLKLPLPGGKHWALTAEAGDGGCTASNPQEPSHINGNHFSLDFSPRSEENSGNPEIDVRVFAAAGGKVAEIGTNPDDPLRNGYYVVLDHDYDGLVETGYTTRYLHLKDLPLVDKGDVVNPGQQLGVMGGTGGWEIHLHIGVRFQNDGGSTEAVKVELRKVHMEGLGFEDYKAECTLGTTYSVAYYPSSNTP
jgi:hypothetical protein